MRLIAPWFLLLLIPVAAYLVWSYPRIKGITKARKRWAFTFRATLLSLLVLAMTQPELHFKNEGVCVLFLVDRSDSISDQQKKFATDYIQESTQKLGPKDQFGIIAFGRTPMLDQSPSSRAAIAPILSKIDGSATDLSSAIRLASGIFPDGKAKRLVLLSDGVENHGDAQESAEAANVDGIQIDSVLLPKNEKKGHVAVSEVQTPTNARKEQPFELKIGVDSDVATSGILTLDRNGEVVKQLTVQLHPGHNTLVVDQALADVGMFKYRATLTTEADPDPRNKLANGFVAIKDKPRLLVLQSPTDGGELAKSLMAQGLEVTAGGPGRVPSSMEDLQGFDAVFLNNFNALNMTPEQMTLLASAVKNSGIGFAMIGGDDSFLPGGYYGTPIADILPVDLNVRNRRVLPPASVLVVVDTSGSMGMPLDGAPKIRLAAKAAALTVDLLGPNDRVGVCGFDTHPDYVEPLQPALNKEDVKNQVERITSGGGGIAGATAIRWAWPTLAAETSSSKHLILLSDGNDYQEYGDSMESVIAMRAQGITSSFIAFGDGKDVEYLKKLAAAGGGRFYLATRANQLPQVFTQDTAEVARSAIEEGVFFPKVTSNDEIIRGIDGFPRLKAYCLSEAKPLAKTILVSEKDDPVLATMRVGLATTLAYTSDARPKWAADWLGWDGFGKFWAQASRSILRSTATNKYQIQTQPGTKSTDLVLTATDDNGLPIDNMTAPVTLLNPDGSSQPVALEQTGSGKYVAHVSAEKVGTYLVSVADSAQSAKIATMGFNVPYPPEYKETGSNAALMAETSRLTGGKSNPDSSAVFRQMARAGYAIQPIAWMLLLASLLLVPVDVASRRIAIPVGAMTKQIWVFITSKLRRGIISEEVNESLDRLSTARLRAKHHIPAPVAKVYTPAETAPPKEERIQTAEPRKPAASTSGTSQALLEAKRKRNESQEK